MKTVLVVEDEPQIAQIVRDYLQHAGFGVVTTGDGAEALLLVHQRQPLRQPGPWYAHEHILPRRPRRREHHTADEVRVA